MPTLHKNFIGSWLRDFSRSSIKTLNNEELADGPGGGSNCVHAPFNCAVIYSVDPPHTCYNLTVVVNGSG
jgi:hypothetical protein